MNTFTCEYLEIDAHPMVMFGVETARCDPYGTYHGTHGTAVVSFVVIIYYRTSNTRSNTLMQVVIRI